MATTNYDAGNLTFIDFFKQVAPDGKTLMPVAETLNQVNSVLQDGPMTPSNAMLGHRITVETALPTVSLGKFDQGIQLSKGTTEQRNEAMALFTSANQIDNKYRKPYGPKFDQFRFQKDRPHIRAMSQQVALHTVYGEQGAQIDEGSFDGFAVRMGSLQQPAPGSAGSQVWSHGSVTGGDGTSIYIIDWHADMGAHFIYPELDANGGLEVKNFENWIATDKDGTQYSASRSEFYWAIGVAVENPNHIARLANVDVSDANLGGLATQGYLIDDIINIVSYMPSADGFNRVMYVHPRILAAWRKQISSRGPSVVLTMDQYLGQLTPHFDGIPVRRLDRIAINEGTVS